MGIIGLWQARNYVQTGYHRFSAISDHGIYCHGASVAAQLNGKPYRQQLAEWGYPGYPDVETLYKIAPELRDARPAAMHCYMHDKAVEVIAKNPLVLARLYPKGVALTMTGPGSLTLLELTGQLPDSFRSTYREAIAQRGIAGGTWELCQKYPLTFLVTAICTVLILGYYLMCVIAALNHRALLLNIPTAAVLSVGLYLILVAGGVMGAKRYRTPAMPMICIVAGLGLATVALRVTRGRDTAGDQPITDEVPIDDSERHLEAA